MGETPIPELRQQNRFIGAREPGVKWRFETPPFTAPKEQSVSVRSIMVLRHLEGTSEQIGSKYEKKGVKHQLKLLHAL